MKSLGFMHTGLVRDVFGCNTRGKWRAKALFKSPSMISPFSWRHWKRVVPTPGLRWRRKLTPLRWNKERGFSQN